MHQQYRSWLFSEEDLSPEQLQELQAHLRECESCCSFAAARDAVEAHLQAAPQRMPSMGFVSRWRERLDLERIRAHQRQTSRLLVSLSVAGSLLVAPLALWIYLMLRSPQEVIISAAREVANWMGWVRFLMETSIKVGGSVANLLPNGWWLMAVGVIAGMSILWVGSIYRFAFKRVEKGVA